MFLSHKSLINETIRNRISLGDNPGVNAILDLPDYLYPVCVGGAWEHYLQQLFDLKDRNLRRIESVHFPCLLPPRYYRLKAWSLKGLQVQAFMRHAGDETFEEWERLHQYAVQVLARKEATRHDRLRSIDKSLGAITILAFGARFKLFYYAWYSPSSPATSPATKNSYSRRIAASIANPDPAMRMIPLVLETRPMDLHKTDERAELELWIERFCAGHDTVFDPIVDEYVPTKSRT